MTNEELKLHFDLKKCMNPPHEFKIGNLIGEWQWANDKWSQLIGDKLQTSWLSFHTTTNLNSTTIYCFTFWKLKLVIGILK